MNVQRTIKINHLLTAHISFNILVTSCAQKRTVSLTQFFSQLTMCCGGFQRWTCRKRKKRVSFRSKTGEFQISLEKLDIICSAKVSFGTLDATVSIGPSLFSVNGV